MNSLSQSISDSLPPPGPAPKVVVVDDDEIVTQSLGSFLELETTYDVLVFQSASEALQRMKQTSVDLVISDFLMPKMNGLEFLTEAKKLYPDVPRILLTGYADKENAIKAINEVGLYQYLEKPWDNDNLKLVIQNAIDSRSMTSLLRSKIAELDRVLRQRDEVFEREGILREELEVARRVQQSFLPTELPANNGLRLETCYKPLMEIGGDFYDVLPLDKGRWAILLADTTGHGIQAALCTALLKFAFHSVESKAASASCIMSTMNTVLRLGLPSTIFVAALVAIVEPKKNECRIVNGGLPHPYLIQEGGCCTKEVPADGLLLGFADDETFRPGEEKILSLKAGDRLLLYTDGLTEAGDSNGRFFGDEGIANTLAPMKSASVREIVDGLARAVAQHQADGEERDDITILGLEITNDS